MKGLREKFRNKKGFTLVEMLIVVALIAILVAISIPMVNTSLDKAKENTDLANLRAAKATGAIEALGNNKAAGTYSFDAENGVLVESSKTFTYGQHGTNAGNYIEVTIGSDQSVSAAWHTS